MCTITYDHIHAFSPPFLLLVPSQLHVFFSFDNTLNPQSNDYLPTTIKYQSLVSKGTRVAAGEHLPICVCCLWEGFILHGSCAGNHRRCEFHAMSYLRRQVFTAFLFILWLRHCFLWGEGG